MLWVNLLADPERKAPFRRVGIDRENLPVHPICPGWQRSYADPHDAARYAGAAADNRPRRIRHLGTAEGRLQLLREPERDGGGRGFYRVADAWIGMVESGVSARLRDDDRERKQRGDDRFVAHGQNGFAGVTGPPKIGLPMVVGNRSSR